MIDHYTYRVTWSAEDDEHVGLCLEFPSLSWLAPTLDEAFSEIRGLVRDVVTDLNECRRSQPRTANIKWGVWYGASLAKKILKQRKTHQSPSGRNNISRRGSCRIPRQSAGPVSCPASQPP